MKNKIVGVLLPQAEQGDTWAKIELGRCYEFGVYPPPVDYVRAVEWYMKAAERGDTTAVWDLRRCYGTARFYCRNIPQAAERNRRMAEIYRMAALRGDTWAQIELGRRYSCGCGVSKDEARAMEWFRMAEMQGDPHATAIIRGIEYGRRKMERKAAVMRRIKEIRAQERRAMAEQG